jgi:hypothetical protein
VRYRIKNSELKTCPGRYRIKNSELKACPGRYRIKRHVLGRFRIKM